jgi:hypothetical protein
MTIGAGTLLLLARRQPPASARIRGMERLPAPLLAMLAATAAQAIGQFDRRGHHRQRLRRHPARACRVRPWPSLPLNAYLQLVGPAFAIALWAPSSRCSPRWSRDGMTGTRHDSNQELIGQGIANILSPLFGGFAATGAIARTATNIEWSDQPGRRRRPLPVPVAGDPAARPLGRAHPLRRARGHPVLRRLEHGGRAARVRRAAHRAARRPAAARWSRSCSRCSSTWWWR